MSEDLFRDAKSFDKWAESFNLDRVPEEDKERFLSSIRALSKNVTLKWLLARLEATQMTVLARVPLDKPQEAEAARMRLIAVRDLRGVIDAFAEESTLDKGGLPKHRGLT